MLKFHQLRFQLEGLLQNKKYFRDSKQKSKRKNTQEDHKRMKTQQDPKS